MMLTMMLMLELRELGVETRNAPSEHVAILLLGQTFELGKTARSDLQSWLFTLP